MNLSEMIDAAWLADSHEREDSKMRAYEAARRDAMQLDENTEDAILEIAGKWGVEGGWRDVFMTVMKLWNTGVGGEPGFFTAAFDIARADGIEPALVVHALETAKSDLQGPAWRCARRGLIETAQAMLGEIGNLHDRALLACYLRLGLWHEYPDAVRLHESREVVDFLVWAGAYNAPNQVSWLVSHLTHLEGDGRQDEVNALYESLIAKAEAGDHCMNQYWLLRARADADDFRQAQAD